MGLGEVKRVDVEVETRGRRTRPSTSHSPLPTTTLKHSSPGQHVPRSSKHEGDCRHKVSGTFSPLLRARSTSLVTSPSLLPPSPRLPCSPSRPLQHITDSISLFLPLPPIQKCLHTGRLSLFLLSFHHLPPSQAHLTSFFPPSLFSPLPSLSFFASTPQTTPTNARTSARTPLVLREHSRSSSQRGTGHPSLSLTSSSREWETLQKEGETPRGFKADKVSVWMVTAKPGWPPRSSRTRRRRGRRPSSGRSGRGESRRLSSLFNFAGSWEGSRQVGERT